jgi:putative DNA primase/helicase
MAKAGTAKTAAPASGGATVPQILPSPAAPMAVARQFVERRCLYNGAAEQLTLQYWHGCWWIWRTTHWVEVAERVIRARLYAFTEYAFYSDEAEAKPWLPNRKKIGDLLEALSGIVILSDEFEQPCWIDGRETGPIVALTNGLLDIASRQLLPHSPLYFGQVSVAFPYDPAASEPRKFLDFLDALWPDDPEAIDLVGEMYGYIISGRTDLHKICMLVGPTRGGKGTLARLLQTLIGKQNACGPTLSSLGTEFGLGPLLGKSLAVISDVRFAGKNSEVAVERLLSISGEDTITVNRKYREQWTGKLPTRFLILSNLLPKLTDASNAIIGRIVLATSKLSWLGREDYQLENKIRSSDMPGILNFSLEGLRRLTIDNDNQFTRLQSSEDAVTTLRDLASPVAAFVRERCKLGSAEENDVDELYKAFKQWADTNEYLKMDKGHFGRDLRAACPSVKKTRPRDGTRRRFVYAGITLRPVGEDGQEAEAQTEFAL